MSGYADHVDRLNRELDEQLASGAKSLEALAIVAEHERQLAERRAATRRCEHVVFGAGQCERDAIAGAIYCRVHRGHVPGEASS